MSEVGLLLAVIGIGILVLIAVGALVGRFLGVNDSKPPPARKWVNDREGESNG